MRHPSSDIQSIKIGNNTLIWQFCVILEGASIGDNCNVCAHVFIENDVIIGNNVIIKSGVQVWDGLRIEDNVFIGPNVTFTNDLVPRSKNQSYKLKNTIIRKGASIGANATIIAGNEIGYYSMIGAGSVVTKDVGKNELWQGNPAIHVGYILNDGEILDIQLKSKKTGEIYTWQGSNLVIADTAN